MAAGILRRVPRVAPRFETGASGLAPLCYTAPEFHALEVERIFRTQWLLVGRADEVERPGDYFCVDVAGEPLVVVRGAEEQRMKDWAQRMKRLVRQGDEYLCIVEDQGLADEIIRVNGHVSAVPSGPEGIESRSEIIAFRDRWAPGVTIDVGVTTVLINGAVAIAAVPGEPLHRLQRIWKERAEVPVPLFYGYTFSSGGTWAGYIPDLRSAAHGGYGADASTRIEIGAGERIMERHLINLYDMQKRWLAKPGAP